MGNKLLGRLKRILRKIPGLIQLRYLYEAYNAPLGIVVKSHKRMKRFKKMYQGKRCFVVGNGPSLNEQDLDLIKDEYSFGVNSIYKIFNRTVWRPTFYCVQDYAVFEGLPKKELQDISNLTHATFIRMATYGRYTKKCELIKRLVLTPIWTTVKDKETGGAPFSEKSDFVIYDASTVTYMALQLAAYMGFEEIFLIGVDNNMPYHTEKDGSITVNDLSIACHFYDKPEDNIGKDAYIHRAPDYEMVNDSYLSAENYSRRKGSFRIYNATRGGKLEAFERVDLDSVVGHRNS